MAQQCIRCGTPRPDPAIPHRACWDHRLDEAGAEALLAEARRGDRSAVHLLGEIGDERAVGALRRATSDDDPRIRAAAVRGLGWTGRPEDVPLLTDRLMDMDPKVRSEARATMAEIADQGAREPLFASLRHAYAVGEADQVIDALAWLGDQRARDPLRRQVRHRLGAAAERGGPGVASGLVGLGHAEDRELLRDQVLLIVRAAALLGDNERLFHTRSALVEYSLATRTVAPDEVAETLELVAAMDPFVARALGHQVGEAATPRTREPLGPRIVSRLGLVPVAEPPGEPYARFGGAPRWSETPRWPLDDEGLPLIYYGEVPWDEGVAAKIFVGQDVGTWDPLGAANCVVVDGGPPPHRPTRPTADGPIFYEAVAEKPPRYRRRWRMVSLERFFELHPGHEPEQWDFAPGEPGELFMDEQEAWNKLGGTPNYLQGEFGPDEAGWVFAGQFSAGVVGHELADGAECYLFRGPDGAGAFGWQCH